MIYTLHIEFLGLKRISLKKKERNYISLSGQECAFADTFGDMNE